MPNNELIEKAIIIAPDFFPSESFPDSAIRIIQYAMSAKNYRFGPSSILTKEDIQDAEEAGVFSF